MDKFSKELIESLTEAVEHAENQTANVSASAKTAALLQRRYGSENQTANWDAADYLHAFGNAGAALLYAALFVPDLIEVEGHVFLKDLGVLPPGGWPELAADIAKARDTSPESVKQYMSGCNWIEVPYLFMDQSGSSDEIDALAKTIQQAWDAHLLKQYPQKTFEVRVLTPAETGSVVGVGFVEMDAVERAANHHSS